VLYPLSYGGQFLDFTLEHRHGGSVAPTSTKEAPKPRGGRAYRYHLAAMAPSGKRILVCDDDPVILRLLQVNLELEGYDVLLANHGEEAFEVARAQLPDLIILDIMMPRMDGYQTVAALKANESTNRIPVVFLSAKAQASDIERGKEQGVADYLTKPFDPSDLLDVVGRLVAE
jgi:CheY-like chemotaxis protein